MQSAVLAMIDSVRPSDRPSVTVQYHAKMTPATIMRSSLEDSPMTLVSSRLTSPQNSKGNIGIREGWENRLFLANKSSYLRNGARWHHSSNGGLIGSGIRAFDWYQNHRAWVTLNCNKSEFSRHFALLRIFGRPGRTAKRMKIDPHCQQWNRCALKLLFNDV